VDAAAAAAEVAAALESEALASALRTADFERQLRLAAEAAAAEARQVSAFERQQDPSLTCKFVLTSMLRLNACTCNAALT
jgi:hypothetical protein